MGKGSGIVGLGRAREEGIGRQANVRATALDLADHQGASGQGTGGQGGLLGLSLTRSQAAAGSGPARMTTRQS